MPMIRTIQIRLSRDQYTRIKADSTAFGFESLSAYLRHLALGRSVILEQKITEIHQHIVGETGKKKSKGARYAPAITL